MTGKKAVVSDRRVVSDMVAAPKYRIVSNVHERLNDIIFEDESVIPDFDMPPLARLRIHVTEHLIALRLAKLIHFRSQRIEPLETDRDEYRIVSWRETFLKLFERDDINIKQRFGVDVALMHGERVDAVCAVLCQIDVGDLGKVGGPEYNGTLHEAVFQRRKAEQLKEVTPSTTCPRSSAVSFK
jgi:hypothetical protein